MKTARVPTTKHNVSARLFLRFLFVYLLAFSVGYLFAASGRNYFFPSSGASGAFLPIPLALLGGLLTVSRPYLLLLSILKAFTDAALFYRVMLLTSTGLIDILPWNACFFTIVYAFLLFTAATTSACRFSFEARKRDLKLLFSLDFLCYLAKSLLFIAAALLLVLLWSRLLALIPLA